jgi:hypothetical protein
VWNVVCQSKEITLMLLEKRNYRHTLPKLLIILIYLFPKFFVFCCNTMKSKHWNVGRKVTKIVTEIIYIYIYMYTHTRIYTYITYIHTYIYVP